MSASEHDAFAIVLREGELRRSSGQYVELDSFAAAADVAEPLLMAAPFAQALWGDRPASVAERRAPRTIGAIRVLEEEVLDLAEFLATDGPPVPAMLGHFDVDHAEFADQVARSVREEIAAGHGSNLVLHRTFHGRLPRRDVAIELAVLRSLLRRESGAYWTFLVHFPSHSLIGASPELHLRRDADGLTTMNPISGTYRYPRTGPEEVSLRAFLDDPKEQDELAMVVDEELKIMAELCDERPWVSEPRLRFMSSVAHTEHLVHGISSLPWSDALQRSMIAPTVIGSPLESAFRMAARQDISPRGYLGGVLARVEAGGTSFDSAILIRTARVDASGHVSLPVGSTVVRDSSPEQEAAETTAKATGLLRAFAEPDRAGLQLVAADLLDQRTHDTAAFWSRPEHSDLRRVVREPLRAVVVDHEDRFTHMLAAHLRSLGLEVEVVDGLLDEVRGDADLLVLGPGPGDPGDLLDPRIVRARERARAAVRAPSVPTLAVCLSHQLVCQELGLAVRALPRPHQGQRRCVSYFGDDVRVAFYNSFSAYTGSALPADVDVAADPTTGEVVGVRAPGLLTMQFHPESILSVDGSRVVRDAVLSLLPAPARVLG